MLPTTLFQSSVAQTQTQTHLAHVQVQAPQAQAQAHAQAQAQAQAQAHALAQTQTLAQVNAQAQALFNAPAQNCAMVRAHAQRNRSPSPGLPFRAPNSFPKHPHVMIGVQQFSQPAAPLQTSGGSWYVGMHPAEATLQATTGTNSWYPSASATTEKMKTCRHPHVPNGDYVESSYQEVVSREQASREQAMESVHTPVPGAQAGATNTSFKEYVTYGKALLGDFARKLQG